MAKKLINNGEIFQVVLSQRFKSKLNKTPINFYKKLRIINPSPFMFFFNFNDFKISGSSPNQLELEIIKLPLDPLQEQGLEEKISKRIINLKKSF